MYIRRTSADSLLTIRFVSVSQSTGTLRRPLWAVSVAAYASPRKRKPFTESVYSPPVNAQPRSSRMGSTTERPMTSSRPLSIRPMIVRCAHGQAHETYRW